VADHSPTLQDISYALLLDEISAQPNLSDELGANEMGNVAVKAFGPVVLKIGLSTLLTGPWVALGGVGVKVISHLLPPPQSLFRDVGEIMAMVSGSNYDALCRSALLHLFWGELKKAERKINMAKHHHDERAFAHHVYGLLRGLEGNASGARFELQLALERERLDGPRQRIERALVAMERVS